MASNWTRLLHARETGARAGLPALPRPSSGVLVIDEKLTARSLPGGLLAHVSEAVHYLDLGGVEADSLDAFGAPLSLWAGVTKFYASGSGLRTLGHAADHLTAVRFLYLDGNGLEECELRRLLAKVPPGQLEALDLTGCPGSSPALLADLQALGGPLAPGAFLNGCRVPHQ